jgi:hypothetical protein
MKRDCRSHRARSRDLASGAGGKMSLALGMRTVFVEEDRLDKERVRTSQEVRESVSDNCAAYGLHDESM